MISMFDSPNTIDCGKFFVIYPSLDFKKKGLKVNISDDYVKMKEMISAKKLVKQSDIIILGVPHSSYRKIKIPKKKY